MNIEEVQINSLHLAEESPASRVVDEKEPDFQNNHTSTSSPSQECRGYIPNVFRGINTSGSYHVYGDLHAVAGKMEGSHKVGDLPRGGASSQKRCSQVPSTNMAHNESITIISHPVPRLSSFPTSIIRSAAAYGSLQRPDTPMEEDSIQHPQTSCLRLSPGFIKGVICSPQSPLRSDCQPNSPTESNSSKNATLSLKQPSDCPKDTKARNWKKYKLIVMNQAPDENDKEVQGGDIEATAMSPTQSPYRSGTADGHSEVQAEEGAREDREEILMSQSFDSCSSSTCSSIRYNSGSTVITVNFHINPLKGRTLPSINPVFVFLCAATADVPPVAVTALVVWKRVTFLLTHTAEMTPQNYTQSIPPPSAVVSGLTQVPHYLPIFK